MVGWVRLVDGVLRDGRVEEDGVGSIAVPEPGDGAVLIMAHPAAIAAVSPGGGRDSGAHGAVVGARPDGPLRVLEVALGIGPGTRYVEVRWDDPAEPPSPGDRVAIAADPATLRYFER